MKVTTPVTATPRVLQMASLFDVPLADKATLSWDVTLPVEDQDWNIGLITGPSGAGKSTIARHLWPTATGKPEWGDGAILDDFPPGMGIKDIIGHLTAVGLSSPPAWIRPYRTLSNGEAFRADMARVLAETPPGQTAVVDEFTSVVDRQVAKVASHAVQKTVRRDHRRLVAVTCHYDVVDWLQPDWVLDAATAEFTWRSVQRHPALTLEVHPADRTAWPMFARHHYLSADLHKAAKCFGGWIGGQLVAFTSYLHFPHPHTRNLKMGHRLVVLPDYQGLGIAGRLDDWLGQWLYERGHRYRNVVAHPAMIRYYSTSPRWRDTSVRNHLKTSTASRSLARRQINPRRLGTRSFEYVPPAAVAACSAAG
jgi:GNAT superfamily N-acetyltransferase